MLPEKRKSHYSIAKIFSRKETVMRKTMFVVISFVVLFGVTLFCTLPAIAAEPLKIGINGMFSGPGADLAKSSLNGVQLAVEQINAKGGVLGRKVELLVRDSQTKADLASTHTRDLVIREKVDFLIAACGSSESLSMTAIAKQYKKILFLAVANSPRLTMELFHPYVFQVQPSNMMEARAMAEARGSMYKKWAWIGPDSEAGHQAARCFKEHLSLVNPAAEFIQEQWPKLGETDFTPYITRLISAKPDAIYSSFFGGDCAAFLKQSKPFGLLEKIHVCVYLFLDDLRGMGNELPLGITGSSRGMFFAFNNPRMNQFVKEYYDRFKEYPSDFAVSGYDAAESLAQGVAKAGTTDTDTVIRALEELTFESVRGAIRYRKEDHQANVPMIIGITAKSDKYPFPIFTDIQLLPAEKIWPSIEEVNDSRKPK
jgi:branched-chain amino acid transport system substrate-binding protein